MKPTPIHSIFHPTDFSQGDESAFAHSLRIALAAQTELSLMHVGDADEEMHWSDFPSVRGMLADWGILPPGASAAEVAKTGLRAEKIRRRGKDAGEAIRDYLENEKPDLVVLSTHQRQGLSRWLHPSTAEPVARANQGMTLFVPRRVLGFVMGNTGAVRLSRVLVPVDAHPNPQVAVDAAAQLARTLGCAEVHFILLHVGPEEDMPAVHVPTEQSWTSETRAWPGPVVEHILGTAETADADLIVMSTRGRHGFLDALHGSTTERVLRGCKCPLLTVPVH